MFSSRSHTTPALNPVLTAVPSQLTATNELMSVPSSFKKMRMADTIPLADPDGGVI